MNKQRRLTFNNPDGTFGVVGMDSENQEQKLYECVVKLKDYENLGFMLNDLLKLKKLLKEHKTNLKKLISDLRKI